MSLFKRLFGNSAGKVETDFFDIVNIELKPRNANELALFLSNESGEEKMAVAFEDYYGAYQTFDPEADNYVKLIDAERFNARFGRLEEFYLTVQIFNSTVDSLPSNSRQSIGPIRQFWFDQKNRTDYVILKVEQRETAAIYKPLGKVSKKDFPAKPVPPMS